MKKTKLKFITIAILSFLLLGAMSGAIKAASFEATSSATTVNVGDTITITIKANNATGMYKVTTSNSNVSLISGSAEEFLENNSATVKYKAEKAGTVTITASASGMFDSDNSEKQVTGSKAFNFTIKEKTTSSTNNNTGSNSNNTSNGSTNTEKPNDNNTTTEPKKPNFTSASGTVYSTGEINLRDSWTTSSKATPIAKGTELTLTGKSKETINGYVWSRVSYQGKTKYVASSLITTTKPKEEEPEKSSNKNLSTLKIKDVELSPAFEKETTQYTANVKGDIKKLEIEAKAEDSKAKVEIIDNNELKVGDNIIKIQVTAEDDTVRTYILTVTKAEGDILPDEPNEEKLQLKSLDIEGVAFEQGFNPEVNTYELELNDATVKSLVINAIANQEDAKIEIIGNENFVAGENTVTILLTSADNTQNATYQIKVTLPAEVANEVKKDNDMVQTIIYIIIGIIIAVIIIMIISIIVHKVKNKEDDNESYEELGREDDRINVPEVGERTKPSKGKHSV